MFVLNQPRAHEHLTVLATNVCAVSLLARLPDEGPGRCSGSSTSRLIPVSAGSARKGNGKSSRFSDSGSPTYDPAGRSDCAWQVLSCAAGGTQATMLLVCLLRPTAFRQRAL
jgi:hypothetical protein